ncbi:hypothetical protein V8G56_14925 [Gaetbulibacter aquiaggeris]|uniref:Uncharacterized protein n=1 Tax=Gaetbulibacter aquiaggeris TaxID=1735373 RepID=A0ABW7MT71_9FLAO
MEFYNKLKYYKATKKISWKEIGAVIDKEEATIRIAVKRESLSDLEKKELVKMLSLEKVGEINNTKSELELYNSIYKKFEARFEVQEDKIQSLKENFKMLYDQLTFLQNSILAEKRRDGNID